MKPALSYILFIFALLFTGIDQSSASPAHLRAEEFRSAIFQAANPVVLNNQQASDLLTENSLFSEDSEDDEFPESGKKNNPGADNAVPLPISVSGHCRYMDVKAPRLYSSGHLAYNNLYLFIRVLRV